MHMCLGAGKLIIFRSLNHPARTGDYVLHGEWRRRDIFFSSKGKELNLPAINTSPTFSKVNHAGIKLMVSLHYAFSQAIFAFRSD